MTVRLMHPDLPPEQVIDVPDLSAPHYRAAGWVDAPEPEPQPVLVPKGSKASPGRVPRAAGPQTAEETAPAAAVTKKEATK